MTASRASHDSPDSSRPLDFFAAARTPKDVSRLPSSRDVRSRITGDPGDPALWYDDDDDTAPAKAICASCSVRPECLSEALDIEGRTVSFHGVRGGLDAGERRALLRRPRPSTTTRPVRTSRPDRTGALALGDARRCPMPSYPATPRVTMAGPAGSGAATGYGSMPHLPWVHSPTVPLAKLSAPQFREQHVAGAPFTPRSTSGVGRQGSSAGGGGGGSATMQRLPNGPQPPTAQAQQPRPGRNITRRGGPPSPPALAPGPQRPALGPGGSGAPVMPGAPMRALPPATGAQRLGHLSGQQLASTVATAPKVRRR